MFTIFLDTCPLVLPWLKKSDPLMTDIRNKYGNDYLKRLEFDGAFNTLKLRTPKQTRRIQL
jgi:hypothetical protein